jgi:hypothetical protein
MSGSEVVSMATLDRIEPAYKPWTPSAAGIATEDEHYVGKHRRPGIRRLSMFAIFYSAKHRRRGA